jgi:hypothetical protein
VQFSTAMGPAFAGPLVIHLHAVSTNTAMTGNSNVVVEVAVAARATNDLLSSYTYTTNVVGRLYSSNSLQIITLPQITVTGHNPRNLLDFRVGRLGTNTSDVVVGDLRLLGAEVSAVFTNFMGGF